ncbi:MAG TPA: hypothetical protein VGC74_18090 [Stenotrophomonas sp.]|jgi:hypothetical protein
MAPVQRRKWLTGTCITVLAFPLFAPSAQAVEPLDRFSVRASGYVTSFDTEIRADGEIGRGTQVNLHRDLGLDESNIIANFGLTWRPWQRHEFGLSYYTKDADATRVIDRDIEFEDHLYETSSTIRSQASLDSYEASYTWWAASRERWALGPRVGVIWYRMQLRISLEADVNGNQMGSSVSDEVSADLPAPTIGAGWRWTPAEDWRVSADAGYFTVSIDDIDGDVYFGRAGVEWFPWERAGFSLDYTATRIKVDSNRDSFNGSVEFNDAGLRLGFVYRF